MITQRIRSWRTPLAALMFTAMLFGASSSAVLAAATLVAIFIGRRALGLRDRFAQVCFGLLCGGIVGNLVDRIARGHVLDFLDFHFGSYAFPSFNVADSAISVGVALYVLSSLRTPGRVL